MPHTPGPWQQGGINSHHVGRFNGRNVDGVPVWNGIANVLVRVNETEDNARLITAAPDLLAALELMLSSPKFGNEPSEEAVEKAIAAVAKAKGEQP